MDYTDIYEEYPELRDLKPRRTSPRRSRKRGLTNSGRLIVLLAVILAAAALLALILTVTRAETATVYGKDGEVKEVPSGELESYLAQGWYASPDDLTEIKLYAEDGSVVLARRGDAERLAEKGYYSDITKAYTNMYSEEGRTLYVPNTMVDVYKSRGWHDKLGDIITSLYKSDGSKLAVPKAQAAAYMEEGWTDKLLKVAKKMIGPKGEEEMVFNDDVDAYLKKGWTVAKRVVDPDQPMIALTFDDGPGKYTDKLLDCLDKNNSAATFFVLGELVETYPDTVKKANDIGCEIANHTWDHLNATSAGGAETAESVRRTSDAVKELIGKGTALYRPCYGVYNEDVLGEVGLPAIMWSIDTLDWKTRNADSTYNTVMDDVYDGAIILMHDIHEPTVEAATRLIPKLVEEGYQLVTVSELLEYRKGGAEKGQVYNSAKPE